MNGIAGEGAGRGWRRSSRMGSAEFERLRADNGETRRWHSLAFQVALLVVPAIVAGAILSIAAVNAYRGAAETRLLTSEQAFVAAVDNQLAIYEVALRTLQAMGSLDQPDGRAALVLHATRLASSLGGWLVVTERLETPRVTANERYRRRSADHQHPRRGFSSALAAPAAPPPDATKILEKHSDKSSFDDAFRLLDLFRGPLVKNFVNVDFLVLDAGEGSEGGDGEYFLSYAGRPVEFTPILRAVTRSEAALVAIADGNFRLVANSDDRVQIGGPVPDWVRDAVEGRGSGITTGPGLMDERNVYALARPERVP